MPKKQRGHSHQPEELWRICQAAQAMAVVASPTTTTFHSDCQTKSSIPIGSFAAA